MSFFVMKSLVTFPCHWNTLQHYINLKDYIVKNCLHTYTYIKLINFIRHKNILPDQLNALSIKTWENEEYLRPVVEDDRWLMFGKYEYK